MPAKLSIERQKELSLASVKYLVRKNGMRINSGLNEEFEEIAKNFGIKTSVQELKDFFRILVEEALDDLCGK